MKLNRTTFVAIAVVAAAAIALMIFNAEAQPLHSVHTGITLNK